MTIFWRLVLAHFIADFTLQTNKVATWKRESRVGMLIHILTHPLVTYALTWPYLSMPWVQTHWIQLNGWVCVALLAIFHWLEDEWRVWSIRETGSPDSTGFFLWDQVVHLTMILAFSPTVSTLKPDPWVLPVLCVVLISHFVSVLVFFLENDLWGSSQVLSEKKYQYIAERMIGAALFLLPGPFFLLAFGWIGWIVYLHYGKSQERTWVHLVVGNMAVILLGLLARGLLLS
jgi:hypothetical protein